MTEGECENGRPQSRGKEPFVGFSREGKVRLTIQIAEKHLKEAEDCASTIGFLVERAPQRNGSYV